MINNVTSFWLILLYLSSPFDILLLILFYKLDAQNAEIDVSGAIGIIFFRRLTMVDLSLREFINIEISSSKV